MLEPHRPASLVRPQLPVPLERKLARLTLEYHHLDGLAVGVDGSRHRAKLGVEARELGCGYHQLRSPKLSAMTPGRRGTGLPSPSSTLPSRCIQSNSTS